MIHQKPLVLKKIFLSRKFYPKPFNQNLNLYKILVLVKGFCGMLPVRSPFLAQTLIFSQIDVKNCMSTIAKNVVEAIETTAPTNNEENKDPSVAVKIVVTVGGGDREERPVII